MSKKDTVEVFFIGGPWDGELHNILPEEMITGGYQVYTKETCPLAGGDFFDYKFFCLSTITPKTLHHASIDIFRFAAPEDMGPNKAVEHLLAYYKKEIPQDDQNDNSDQGPRELVERTDRTSDVGSSSDRDIGES